MKISELLTVLQEKLIYCGDVDVKFGQLDDVVVKSKLHEINDVSVEDFEYGTPTIIIWDK